MTRAPDHVQRVVMRDGCGLLTDSYVVPGGASHPSLLHRTLYGRSEQRAGGSLSVEGLLDAGFNVVVQDLRGCHGSDGVFVPYQDDAADTLDTVRWIRGQRWAAPQVAMIGRSYAGLTQWQAATAAENPGLDSIAPEACSADLFRDWSYCGGVFRLGFAVDWLLSDLVSLRPSHPAVPGVKDALGRLLADPEAGGKLAEIEKASPWLAEWMTHSTSDAYWQSRSPANRWGRLHTPALCINGWHDPFLAATLRDFSQIADPPTGCQSAKALVIGPWRHVGNRRAGTAVDLTSLHIEWFRRHRLGGWEDPVRLYIPGADTWLRFPSWPPSRDMSLVRYFLQGEGHQNGSLSLLPPKGQAALGGVETNWRQPLRRPAAPHGYLPLDEHGHAAVEEGAEGREWGDRRAKLLRYVSAPLTAPALLLGEVTAVIWVVASAASLDLSVRLIRVSIAEGVSILLDTIQRVDVRVGGLTRVDVALGAVGQYLHVGERLVLEVAGSNFPEFDLNRTAGPLSFQLFTQPGAASALSLPLHAQGREERVLS
jgi:uncharacterized protein